MSYREQRKYMETLKNYERNFTRDEMEEYKMFIKRQKDDEDFDSVSMKRLKELHNKYYKPADLSKLNDLFKKPDESSADD
jgi:hypothetical protein